VWDTSPSHGSVEIWQKCTSNIKASVMAWNTISTTVFIFFIIIINAHIYICIYLRCICVIFRSFCIIPEFHHIHIDITIFDYLTKCTIIIIILVCYVTFVYHSSLVQRQESDHRQNKKYTINILFQYIGTLNYIRHN
jgi:hypothetical protein